jgi:hypothetical protein
MTLFSTIIYFRGKKQNNIHKSLKGVNQDQIKKLRRSPSKFNIHE